MSMSGNEDLAVFEPAPRGTVDFAPRRVDSGRRADVPVGIWVIGAAVVVCIGAFAGGAAIAPFDRDSGVPASEPVSERSAESTSSQALRLSGPHWPPRLTPIVTFGPIDLQVPGPTSAGLDTAQMDLHGTVRIRATRLRITLERAGNVLGLASVDVSDPNGGIRRDRRPTFNATFNLPKSDFGETLWIAVAAYDESGLPLGETRRPYWAGLPGTP